jgi:hypothetical protein
MRIHARSASTAHIKGQIVRGAGTVDPERHQPPGRI